jgi:hypothetical protein
VRELPSGLAVVEDFRRTATQGTDAFAARRLDLTDDLARRRATAGSNAWQKEAWEYADEIEEVKFAANFRGALMRRLLLYAGFVTDPGQAPIPVEDAAEAGDLPTEIALAAAAELERLGSQDQQSELLGQWGGIATVSGESYLVGQENLLADTGETWRLFSESNMVRGTATGNATAIRTRPGGTPENLDPGDAVIRVWRPHPRWPDLADANMRAVLGTAEEILIYARQMRAVGKSRTSAPLLYVANEMGDPPNPDGKPTLWEQNLITSLVSAITDDAAVSAAAPNMIRGPAAFGRGQNAVPAKDAIFTIDLSRKIDEKAIERISFLVKRLAHGLDVPVEIITGIADVNHWPCDENTEVLTKSGWVSHESLDSGTEVLAFDVESGTSAWEPIAGVVRAQVVDREMIEISGRSHSSLTTPDHRWPFRGRDGRFGWTTSEELVGQGANGPRRMVLGARWADTPTAAKFSDHMVEVMAWAATDAGLTPDRGHRRALWIRQQKASEVAAIRAALAATGLPFSEHPEGTDGLVRFTLLADATEQLLDLGEVLGSRWAPSTTTVEAFTAAQRELFLVTCERANGGTAAHRTVFAVDPRRLRCVEHAAILSGYRVTTKRRNQQHGYGTEPVWRCSWGIRTTFTPTRHHARRVSYTGTIFCPRVPVGRSFFARRDGFVFVTGNTAWQIEDSTYKSHIEPDALVFATALTTELLRPGLLDLFGPAAIPFIRRLTVAINPAALVVRPNRAKDALDAFDRWGISWAALRDHLNFGEDEAPDEDEMLLRLALRSPGAVQLTAPMLDETGLYPGAADDLIEVTGGSGDTSGAVDEAGQDQPTPDDDQPEPSDPAARAAAAALTAARERLRSARVPRGTARSAPGLVGRQLSPPHDRSSRFAERSAMAPALGERLGSIDRELMSRLLLSASDTLTEALRVIGNRLRTQAQGNPAAAQAVKGVPADQVAAALLAAGLPVPDIEPLAADQFDGLGDRWAVWVPAAFAATADAVVRATPDADEATAERITTEVTAAQEARSTAGWSTLLAALIGLAVARTLDPTALTPEGESDALVRVPAGIVRNAIATTGGIGNPGGQPFGLASEIGPGQSVGGIATGPNTTRALRIAGYSVSAWEWHHGIPSNPLPAHSALAGTRFSDWGADVLLNTGAFPPFSHLFPGDHVGCTCSTTAVLAPITEG